MAVRRCAAVAMLAFATQPALAHVGDHAHIQPSDLVAHLLAGDHFVAISIASLLTLAAIGWRVRVRSRAMSRKQEPRS